MNLIQNIRNEIARQADELLEEAGLGEDKLAREVMNDLLTKRRIQGYYPCHFDTIMNRMPEEHQGNLMDIIQLISGQMTGGQSTAYALCLPKGFFGPYTLRTQFTNAKHYTRQMMAREFFPIEFDFTHLHFGMREKVEFWNRFSDDMPPIAITERFPNIQDDSGPQVFAHFKNREDRAEGLLRADFGRLERLMK